MQAHGPEDAGGRTDRSGKFSLDMVAPGTYQVSAITEWGTRSSSDTPRAVEATVAIGRTATVRLIAESTSGSIAGRVTGASGAPITDAYVVAAREDEAAGADVPSRRRRGGWQGPPVLTALDGSFRIAGIPRGTFTLHAYRMGGGEAIVDRVASGEQRARLTIRPTGVLAGVVVPSSGVSIDDVTISARERDLEISREERLYRVGGRFALRDLPAGTYSLAVDDDPRSAIQVTLGEGQRRDDLRIVAQPRFTIRGRLVAPDGRTPVHGWKVEAPRLERSEIMPGGGRLVVTTPEIAMTGPDGRFLLRDLPAGLTTISAGDVSRDVDAKLAVIREVTLQGNTDVDLGDIIVGAP